MTIKRRASQDDYTRYTSPIIVPYLTEQKDDIGISKQKPKAASAPGTKLTRDPRLLKSKIMTIKRRASQYTRYTSPITLPYLTEQKDNIVISKQKPKAASAPGTKLTRDPRLLKIMKIQDNGNNVPRKQFILQKMLRGENNEISGVHLSRLIKIHKSSS